MASDKNLLHNISRRKYLEGLKILPKLQEEKTKAYFTLIFTFAALTIFGIFAINPTLATITDLQKQLEDRKQINQELTQKINNLITLGNKYRELSSDLPVVFFAIPDNPKSPYLLGQVQAIAKQSQLTITSLQSFQVELTIPKKTVSSTSSFIFSLQADGTYQQISAFLDAFKSFDRIVTIENVTITRKEQDAQNSYGPLQLTVRARTYFKT